MVPSRRTHPEFLPPLLLCVHQLPALSQLGSLLGLDPARWGGYGRESPKNVCVALKARPGRPGGDSAHVHYQVMVEVPRVARGLFGMLVLQSVFPWGPGGASDLPPTRVPTSWHGALPRGLALGGRWRRL
jgi:hypothetical protein